MDWFKPLCLSWIIISAAVIYISCQELTSTLSEGNRTCPGKEVTFTCTIRGSQNLTSLALGWSSTEYIGQGNPLQFTSTNNPGTIAPSMINVNVVATLTRNDVVTGVPILESKLRLIADQASMVTCATNGGTENIEFSISAVPGAPQNVRAAEVVAEGVVMENYCTVLVIWNPPANSNISHYIVNVPSRNIMDIESSAIDILLLPNCRDGDIYIQVSAENHFGCVGPMVEVQPTLLDYIPTAPNQDEPTSTTEDGSAPTTKDKSTSTSSLSFGVGAVVGIAFGSAFVAVFICCLFCTFCCLTDCKHYDVKGLCCKYFNCCLEPCYNFPEEARERDDSDDDAQAPTGEDYAVVFSIKQSQDPYSIQHEQAPVGDLYAVTEKKPKKGSEKGSSEEGLTAVYSAPDESKKTQLVYASLDVGGASEKQQPPTEYATVVS